MGDVLAPNPAARSDNQVQEKINAILKQTEILQSELAKDTPNPHTVAAALMLVRDKLTELANSYSNKTMQAHISSWILEVSKPIDAYNQEQAGEKHFEKVIGSARRTVDILSQGMSDLSKDPVGGKELKSKLQYMQPNVDGIQDLETRAINTGHAIGDILLSTFQYDDVSLLPKYIDKITADAINEWNSAKNYFSTATLSDKKAISPEIQIGLCETIHDAISERLGVGGVAPSEGNQRFGKYLVGLIEPAFGSIELFEQNFRRQMDNLRGSVIALYMHSDIESHYLYGKQIDNSAFFDLEKLLPSDIFGITEKQDKKDEILGSGTQKTYMREVTSDLANNLDKNALSLALVLAYGEDAKGLLCFQNLEDENGLVRGRFTDASRDNEGKWNGLFSGEERYSIDDKGFLCMKTPEGKTVQAQVTLKDVLDKAAERARNKSTPADYALNLNYEVYMALSGFLVDNVDAIRSNMKALETARPNTYALLTGTREPINGTRVDKTYLETSDGQKQVDAFSAMEAYAAMTWISSMHFLDTDTSPDDVLVQIASGHSFAKAPILCQSGAINTIIGSTNDSSEMTSMASDFMSYVDKIIVERKINDRFRLLEKFLSECETEFREKATGDMGQPMTETAKSVRITDRGFSVLSPRERAEGANVTTTGTVGFTYNKDIDPTGINQALNSLNPVVGNLMNARLTQAPPFSLNVYTLTARMSDAKFRELYNAVMPKEISGRIEEKKDSEVKVNGTWYKFGSGVAETCPDVNSNIKFVAEDGFIGEIREVSRRGAAPFKQRYTKYGSASGAWNISRSNYDLSNLGFRSTMNSSSGAAWQLNVDNNKNTTYFTGGMPNKVKYHETDTDDVYLSAKKIPLAGVFLLNNLQFDRYKKDYTEDTKTGLQTYETLDTKTQSKLDLIHKSTGSSLIVDWNTTQRATFDSKRMQALEGLYDLAGPGNQTFTDPMALLVVNQTIVTNYNTAAAISTPNDVDVINVYTDANSVVNFDEFTNLWSTIKRFPAYSPFLYNDNGTYVDVFSVTDANVTALLDYAKEQIAEGLGYTNDEIAALKLDANKWNNLNGHLTFNSTGAVNGITNVDADGNTHGDISNIKIAVNHLKTNFISVVLTSGSIYALDKDGFERLKTYIVGGTIKDTNGNEIQVPGIGLYANEVDRLFGDNGLLTTAFNNNNNTLTMADYRAAIETLITEVQPVTEKIEHVEAHLKTERGWASYIADTNTVQSLQLVNELESFRRSARNFDANGDGVINATGGFEGESEIANLNGALLAGYADIKPELKNQIITGISSIATQYNGINVDPNSDSWKAFDKFMSDIEAQVDSTGQYKHWVARGLLNLGKGWIFEGGREVLQRMRLGEVTQNQNGYYVGVQLPLPIKMLGERVAGMEMVDINGNKTDLVSILGKSRLVTGGAYSYAPRAGQTEGDTGGLFRWEELDKFAVYGQTRDGRDASEKTGELKIDEDFFGAPARVFVKENKNQSEYGLRIEGNFSIPKLVDAMGTFDRDETDLDTESPQKQRNYSAVITVDGERFSAKDWKFDIGFSRYKGSLNLSNNDVPFVLNYAKSVFGAFNNLNETLWTGDWSQRQLMTRDALNQVWQSSNMFMSTDWFTQNVRRNADLMVEGRNVRTGDTFGVMYSRVSVPSEQGRTKQLETIIFGKQGFGADRNKSLSVIGIFRGDKLEKSTLTSATANLELGDFYLHGIGRNMKVPELETYGGGIGYKNMRSEFTYGSKDRWSVELAGSKHLGSRQKPINIGVGFGMGKIYEQKILQSNLIMSAALWGTTATLMGHWDQVTSDEAKANRYQIKLEIPISERLSFSGDAQWNVGSITPHKYGTGELLPTGDYFGSSGKMLLTWKF